MINSKKIHVERSTKYLLQKNMYRVSSGNSHENNRHGIYSLDLESFQLLKGLSVPNGYRPRTNLVPSQSETSLVRTWCGVGGDWALIGSYHSSEGMERFGNEILTGRRCVETTFEVTPGDGVRSGKDTGHGWP